MVLPPLRYTEKDLKVYHRSACRVISGVLPLLLSHYSSWKRSPPTGNHIESPSTRLLWTSLSCRQFSSTMASLQSNAPRPKKRPSWRSFWSSLENHASPPYFPLGSPNFIVTTCDCDHQRLLPFLPKPTRRCSRLSQKTPRVWRYRVWTDGSVSSLLGAISACVHEACRRCLSSSPLSYSAGSVSSSFSAESLALGYGLEWCYFHLKTYHFQSALFVTDSQTALVLHSMASAFLQPRSFWEF